jgi:hypothetical protein
LKRGEKLEPLVEEARARGALFVAGTVKSPAYVGREQWEVAREALLRFAGEEAIAEKDLAKLATRLAGVDAKVLPVVAAELVREGQLRLESPPWGGKKKLAACYVVDGYWERRRAAGKELVLRLAGGELLAEKELGLRAASELGKELGAAVVAELLREGKLRKVGSKPGVMVNVTKPEPYLEREIGKLLDAFGKVEAKAKLREFLEGGGAGAALAVNGDVEAVAERMFAAMNRIAFAPGTTVTFYRLRQQPELAGVDKMTFDRAALRLQEQRKALLAIHDHAPRLAQAERDELVTDGTGNYYVSIYSR